MANSVVKVSDIKDDQLSDSLFLLVGEDGTVTPDQDTVETYLKQRNGPTNIKIMKIVKSEKQNIDITVDNVTYMPDVVNEEIVNTDENMEGMHENFDMDEVARNLYNFRLDHDYTPLTSPGIPCSQEQDDLAKTLSILDGPDPDIVQSMEFSEPPPLILTTTPKSKSKAKVNIIQSITIAPPTKQIKRTAPPTLQPVIQQPIPTEKVESPQDDSEREEPPSLEPMVPINQLKEVPKFSENNEDTLLQTTPARTIQEKPKARIIKVTQKQQPKSERVKVEKVKTKVVKEVMEEESDEDYEDYQEEDFDFELEDDENDSDYEVEKVTKTKQTPKRSSRRSKGETKTNSKTFGTKSRSFSKPKSNEKGDDKDAIEIIKEEGKGEQPEKSNEKSIKVNENIDKSNDDQKGENTDAKAEKKLKKKKEAPKPLLDDFALFSTPDIIRRVGGKEPTTPSTPGTPDVNSGSKPAKITLESRTKSADQNSSPINKSISNRSSLDSNKLEKDKDKHSLENKNKERRVSSDVKPRHLSTEEKSKSSKSDKLDSKKSAKTDGNVLNTEDMPSAEDIRCIILNEDTKSFTTSSVPMESELSNSDPNNINLDATGLDIDPSILDNLNNDEISEDILYQVAKSLVSNPELQNAIDKGINEGVLDPMTVDQNVISNQTTTTQEKHQSDVIQKGTQIVRPDGRIVVIPPIERPTTRSRGKKKEEEKPTFKPVHKPLDDEHVSGNELDSSNDEEESEDDPNKLWCICNQPHNNRFMICCDTCEEWYHGKCVNITKTMGQQMEAEGREWICLFCKDPTLKRPQAAARRVRKASRNSRASTDSAGSSQKSEISVPCVVCQKPARKNSIYCSEACILAHAQGIERVVVFERSTGKMLMGNKAPSAANLDQWLKEHPGYEVVRSGGKVVTAKAGTLTQSKLKLVKNNDNEGVSLAVQKKGVSLGVLKHGPKHSSPSSSPQSQNSPKQQQAQHLKQAPKATVTSVKLGVKKVVNKEGKKLVVQSQIPTTLQTTPNRQKEQKVVQATPTKTPQSTEKKPKLLAAQVKSPIIKEKPPIKERTPVKPKVKPETPPTPQPKPQENIRDNVQKTVLEHLTNRLKDCDDIKLTEEEIKNISTEIEEQLYKCFGDTGQKYRNKYRSLIFNIKDPKNHTLWRRICEKSIGPYELVRLSPDDMASQELAKWRENEAKHSLDMIKKSELELLNCNRQYVLKTHKGEQVVEDDRGDKVDNTEVIKSLTEGSTLEGDENSRSEKDKDKKASSKHREKERDRDRKSRDYRSHRSSSRERDRSRRRSRSRDRKYDHKKHSRDRDRDRHRKSTHKSSRHKKDIISTTDKLDKKSKEILEQLVDNKIVPPLEDRLWKHVPQEDIVPGKALESDSDHEPTSTVTIPTPPRSQEDENVPISPEKDLNLPIERSMSPPPKSKPVEIWRGVINMVDVAQISITAHEVSGDCVGLGKELADNLNIVGRISPDTVWEYIGKMKCSNSKGISLLRLNATNMEEKMPYLALYSYLSSRDRLGVVRSTTKAVKDFYIYPLAPQKPIPQVLLPINGPGFEESRPALLLGIVVRDKRISRPYIESILPAEVYPKKQKVEVPPAQPPLVTAPPPLVTAPPPPPPPAVTSRSYTPPPLKDPRLKLPPPVTPVTPDEGDEPYSPGDSSPDAPVLLEQPPVPLIPPPMPPILPPILTPAITTSSISDSLSSAPFTALPGSSALPSSTLEIQRQMEELNKKIEMQKSEITSMTKNIVSASSEIGSSALANISLPSNLQQILENIKMIGETTDSSTPPPPKETIQADLTIPLMIPKSFSRPLNNPLPVPPPPMPVPPPIMSKIDLSSDTIPLNLPTKPKIKPPSVNSPILEDKTLIGTTSVLGSLSEEDLIRKAAEMLGEDEAKSSKKRQEKEPLIPTPPKRSRQEISLPPVPGMEDDILL